MNQLLDAVDALTLPTHTLVAQWVTRNGRETSQSTRIEHDPLLAQLEAAIASTIGAGGGRAMTAAWALNVLDSGALHQFSIIDSTIRDWCRMAGVKPGRHAAGNLRAWYAATLSRNLGQGQIDFYQDQLHQWATTIRSKLNPARALELTAACPACGADLWTDTDGTAYRHPITITYREHDTDILANARALCRACERVWKGSSELRELRWDVDQAEEPTSA